MRIFVHTAEKTLKYESNKLLLVMFHSRVFEFCFKKEIQDGRNYKILNLFCTLQTLQAKLK